MTEDKKSLDNEASFDDLKGFFPEEYDLSPEELLNTPDCDSFDTSDASPLWEDLDNITPKAEEDAITNVEENENLKIEETVQLKRKKKKKDSSQSNKSALEDLYDILEMFAVCAACIIIFFSFFARLTIVDGTSMCDTLKDGEWLVISDFMYEATPGDIVVIQDTSLDHPELRKPLVKRVIALGGQSVDISASGVVTVTDEDGIITVLDESYTKNEPYLKSAGHFEVPEGHIFVMGDNRNGSTDSRDSRVGFIDERCVIGCAQLRIFPIDSFNVITNPFEKE